MERNHLSVWQQLALGIFLILTVLAFSLIWIVDLSARPYQEAKSKAEEVAKTHTDLESIDNFAVFNKKKTYYSLLGKAANGEELAVLVPEAGGDILVYQAKRGLTAEEAAKEAADHGSGPADRVTFGILGRKPIWEVYAGRNYYYIDFETGDLISKEGL